VFDDYLRKRASKLGANLINGLFMGIETTQGAEGPITIRYNEYKEGEWLPARLGWLGLRWLMLASVEPACRMRGFSNNWRWPGVVLRAASAAAAAASPSTAAHTSSTHPPPTAPSAPPAPRPHPPDPAGEKVGIPRTMEVDLVIGADGANSRVAKDIDAGEYDYAIAFQERIRISEDKMDYYKDLAEM
jgi:hypothetical protein